MASSPLMSQPAPSRSPEKSNADLRHPVPDLQSLQGAYIGNIERLEESAERMSEPGSDLQEEIRKSYSELKRSDSRRSSLHSIQPVDDYARQYSSRSRNVSTSSHANSIVDLNGGARWGGYSPGGYITSPVGSLRSGSWSNPPTSTQRQRSGSKASRLGQVVHPEEVEEEAERLAAYPRSPQSLQSAPPALHNTDSPPPQEQRKVSSFTRIYDEVANGLPEELRNSVILGQPPDHGDQRQRQDNQYRYASQHDLPDRPPTAASTDTTHQARTLWQDFDGVHCPDTVIEEEPTPSHSSHGHSRQSSNHSFLMRSNPDLPTMGAPPPDDSMVFYPAPVPKMLNLPKRLSQLPATSVQAKRRTQLLESMQQENRKSAPLLGDMTDLPKPNNRKSRQSLMALPPQLRASAYFDQIGPAQEFAVKGESAEDTLDSILDASARAPVSAFTDHPFAGHVGKEVYGPEHKRKSSKLPAPPPMLQETKRRSSFNVLDTKLNSSGDPLNKLKKRNSSADMNLLIVKASESRMSLGGELDERDEHARGPEAEYDTTPARRLSDDENEPDPDDALEDEPLQGEEDEEEEQEEQFYGGPTTLLAELQLRKAKQKTRNMNYATLVEQGMMTSHRTLLEMDDMAEKEKQKRLRKKVHLAWEAQAEDDDSDDDVPLGVLYKQGGGQQTQDWNQPIGLIAQRELEDSEPLSLRRNRLKGKRSTQFLGASLSQANLAVPATTSPGPQSDEEEGETLGERMRRLKDKQMLEAALGDDVRKSTVSGDFAAEMLSKLGIAEGEEKKQEHPQPTPSPGIEEEETLGQRRARLQAEAAARGDAPPPTARPGLRSSMSLANILSANPIDTTNQARKVSNEALVSHLPQGSLLHQNVLAEERRKAQRLTQNMRASSYGNMDPLLRNVADKPKKDDDGDAALAAKIQAYKNKMAGIVPPQQQSNMMFNGGGQMMGNMSSANLTTAAQRDSFMPQGMGMMNGMSMPMSQPNLNMSMPINNMNMGMGGFQYPQSNNPQFMRQSSMMSMPMMGVNNMGMGGMNMNMNMGMGMGMGMGSSPSPSNMMMMMQPPMDPRQRDQIDRWVQGVRH
ncbi:Nn.00g047910.m01.CDS01 [Neocucurbitaria sp. VM-36]